MVLDTALPQHDAAAATLVVDALNRELRELTEKFPERKDSAVTGGLAERSRARSALKQLVLSLHGLDDALQAGQFEAAAAALGSYRAQLPPTVEDHEGGTQLVSVRSPDSRRALRSPASAVPGGR